MQRFHMTPSFSFCTRTSALHSKSTALHVTHTHTHTWSYPFSCHSRNRSSDSTEFPSERTSFAKYYGSIKDR